MTFFCSCLDSSCLVPFSHSPFYFLFSLFFIIPYYVLTVLFIFLLFYYFCYSLLVTCTSCCYSRLSASFSLLPAALFLCLLSSAFYHLYLPHTLAIYFFSIYSHHNTPLNYTYCQRPYLTTFHMCVMLPGASTAADKRTNQKKYSFKPHSWSGISSFLAHTFFHCFISTLYFQPTSFSLSL